MSKSKPLKKSTIRIIIAGLMLAFLIISLTVVYMGFILGQKKASILYQEKQSVSHVLYKPTKILNYVLVAGH